MHGVKRSSKTAEATAGKKEKEKTELASYLELEKELLRRKSEQDWSEDALRLTTTLLQRNPEYYTIWNYRRNIILNVVFASSVPSQPKSIFELLNDELDLTMSLLRHHPKVYWIWNHRRWCLENTPLTPKDVDTSDILWKKQQWDRELVVVERMLNQDPRNFHAWDYRRHVLASHPVPKSDADELVYTQKKIEVNFSNFSAWHQRSKVAGTRIQSQEWRDSEFELVRSALWTDPSDQSTWIYHRWLMGRDPSLVDLDREIAVIEELLEEEPNSKWCLQTLFHCLKLKSCIQNDLGPHRSRCLGLLSRLIEIDPLRVHRYKDLEVRLQ